MILLYLLSLTATPVIRLELKLKLLLWADLWFIDFKVNLLFLLETVFRLLVQRYRKHLCSSLILNSSILQFHLLILPFSGTSSLHHSWFVRRSWALWFYLNLPLWRAFLRIKSTVQYISCQLNSFPDDGLPSFFKIIITVNEHC